MSEEADALRARLDAFSHRLDAKTCEFKATGKLGREDAIESLRNRHQAMKTKWDRAIRSGSVSDLLKLEFERNFEGLVDEFSRMEKEFDAAGMRDAKAPPNHR